MNRRNRLVRLDRCWSGLCVWFMNRSPLPQRHSLHILRVVAAVFRLPAPCPNIARHK